MSTMLAFPSFIDAMMDFLETKAAQRLQFPAHPTASGGCKICHTSVCQECQHLGRTCLCGVMDVRRRHPLTCSYADDEDHHIDGVSGDVVE